MGFRDLYIAIFMWFPQPNQSPEEGTRIDKLPLTPAVKTKAIDVSNRSTSQLRSETTFESSKLLRHSNDSN